MTPGTTPATGTHVQTPSGLLVPVDAADHLATHTPKGGDPCRDSDGRRRVVLTKADQKMINRAIQLLGRSGFGVIVTCQQYPGQPGKCGAALRNEGQGQPDDGYGCRCTRVHFR